VESVTVSVSDPTGAAEGRVNWRVSSPELSTFSVLEAVMPVRVAATPPTVTVGSPPAGKPLMAVVTVVVEPAGRLPGEIEDTNGVTENDVVDFWVPVPVTVRVCGPAGRSGTVKGAYTVPDELVPAADEDPRVVVTDGEAVNPDPKTTPWVPGGPDAGKGADTIV
jgi:hypothetical protein